MEIPDLSKLGQPEETVSEESAQDPTIKARTAFLVVVYDSGDVVASPDINLAVEREEIPSTDDMYGACAVVQRDISMQLTAHHTMIAMQQMAMAQAQRLQEAQLLQGLNLKGQ